MRGVRRRVVPSPRHLLHRRILPRQHRPDADDEGEGGDAGDHQRHPRLDRQAPSAAAVAPFGDDRIQPGLLAAEPNAGHHALAELERAGLVQAVVTQNIDLLHSRAGSVDVTEVHGSIARFTCLACAAEELLEPVLGQLEVREAPECPACGSVLKPGVVMFGELLPPDEMLRAELLCRNTGLLLVVGSSLQVWPVAGLPDETLSAGGALAIVNLDETPYDAHAATIVRDA